MYKAKLGARNLSQQNGIFELKSSSSVKETSKKKTKIKNRKKVVKKRPDSESRKESEEILNETTEKEAKEERIIPKIKVQFYEPGSLETTDRKLAFFLEFKCLAEK